MGSLCHPSLASLLAIPPCDPSLPPLPAPPLPAAPSCRPSGSRGMPGTWRFHLAGKLYLEKPGPWPHSSPADRGQWRHLSARLRGYLTSSRFFPLISDLVSSNQHIAFSYFLRRWSLNIWDVIANQYYRYANNFWEINCRWARRKFQWFRNITTR